DLRQTFRTVATAAGVSEFDAKLLMNHSIPGVKAGYVTPHQLLEDHLRDQQQAISTAVFSSLDKPLSERGPLAGWLSHAASREIVGRLELRSASTDKNKATFGDAA